MARVNSDTSSASDGDHKLITDFPVEIGLEEVFGFSNKKSVSFSTTSTDTTESSGSTSHEVGLSCFPQPRPRSKKLIQCKYANCGCLELLERGTLLEKDHYETCDYRPLRCLLGHDGCEPVPYHDFILHHVAHCLQPCYTLNLQSSIILWKDDFQQDQRWSPKWMSAGGNQFFLNLWRKTPGIWSSWVCMLGSEEQASKFLARITFYKGLKSFGGIYPVCTVRAEQEDLEKSRTILLTTDAVMKEVSKIGDNLITDICVMVHIVHNHVNPELKDELKEELKSKLGETKFRSDNSAKLSSDAGDAAHAQHKRVPEQQPRAERRLVQIFEEDEIDEAPGVVSTEFLEYLSPPSAGSSAASSLADLGPLSSLSVKELMARSAAISAENLLGNTRKSQKHILEVASAPADLGGLQQQFDSTSSLPPPTSSINLDRELAFD